MKKPDLMVFDLDGTLIDSMRDLAVAINFMRAQYGLPEVSIDTAKTFVGNGAKTLVHRALGDCKADFDAALKCYRDYYASHQLVHTKL